MEPKADLDPTWIWGRIRNTVGIELFRSNVTTFCCSSTGHCFIVFPANSRCLCSGAAVVLEGGNYSSVALVTLWSEVDIAIHSASLRRKINKCQMIFNVLTVFGFLKALACYLVLKLERF